MKQLGFNLAAFFKRQPRGGFDGVNRRKRSDQVALLFADSFSGRRKDLARFTPACPVSHCVRAFSAPACPTTSCAKATAPANKSPSINRSTIPALSASGALTGFPSVHISTAFATPASRGRRCVPRLLE